MVIEYPAGESRLAVCSSCGYPTLGVHLCAACKAMPAMAPGAPLQAIGSFHAIPLSA